MSAIHDRANQQKCYFHLMAWRKEEKVFSWSNWAVLLKKDETDTRWKAPASEKTSMTRLLSLSDEMRKTSYHLHE